jgi:hypothetical protein
VIVNFMLKVLWTIFPSDNAPFKNVCEYETASKAETLVIQRQRHWKSMSQKFMDENPMCK